MLSSACCHNPELEICNPVSREGYVTSGTNPYGHSGINPYGHSGINPYVTSGINSLSGA